MWIFTNFGFFSVVRHREDKKSLLVRGRSLSDMTSLARRYGHLLNITVDDIETTPFADYLYRITVPAASWSKVMSQITADIDYGNFKDSVKKNQGPDRAHAYMDIWSTMFDIQEQEFSQMKDVVQQDLNNESL